MCIDENGSSSNLTYVLKQILNDREVSEDDKFLQSLVKLYILLLQRKLVLKNSKQK